MADINDNDSIVWISIPLDGATAARLAAVADDCHSEPIKVAASLLHDVLADDEDAHFLLTAPPAGQMFN